MSSYDGRRRSSAAAAYAPPQGYASQDTYQEPGTYEDTSQAGSVPYGPPDPIIAPQPQHPGARRRSSHQPPPTAPMAVPRHPGYQSSASYGPAYGNGAPYQQQPPSSYPPPQAPQQGYGTSPNGAGYYGTSPNTYAPHPQSAHPPRPTYNTTHHEDDAVTFDETADYHPSDRRQSRSYSHSSTRPDGRRLSAAHAYDDRDRYDDAYRIPPGSAEPPRRRDSRSPAEAYEGNSDYSDGYEAGYEAAERRERRASKASTHSRESRGSRHRSKGSGSSRDEARTYGDSMTWAWSGMKKFLSSSRD